VEQGERLIAQVRSLTDRPFNVNLFCHQPTRPSPERDAAWLDHLRPQFARWGADPPSELHEIYPSARGNTALQAMVLRRHPELVSFHFGLPDNDFLRALHDAGIVTMACVTSPEEARQVERAGVDLVIAQGLEAGGHRGCFDPADDAGLTTRALVALLVRQTDLPVIATGAIMNGADIAELLALGASAVQLGTAFLLCPESSADPAYRAALRHQPIAATAITAAISGRPARGLVNRFHMLGQTYGRPLPGYPRTYEAGKALHRLAVAHGCDDYAAHWAGQGVSLIREMPAAALIETLANEWREAVERVR
jgi:nitronate monooxygenase